MKKITGALYVKVSLFLAMSIYSTIKEPAEATVIHVATKSVTGRLSFAVSKGSIAVIADRFF